MISMRNRIQLIGNLGQDIELKVTESGKKIARISLATNEFYKNASGEKVQDTQWHPVVAWGKLAENMSAILKKGSELAVEGRLVHRSYDDKEGTKKYVSEVVADRFIALSKKQEALPF